MGASLVALQIAAFSGIEASVSGLAGGLFETAREIGGTIGIAAVGTLAISRTNEVLGSGAAPAVAMTEAYQRASVVSALLSVTAAVVAAVLLRRAERPGSDRPDDEPTVATDEHEVARV
jgi:cobalamin biosynthesis protein CbiG